MNYISEINGFYVWLVENPISGNAQALWHRLMAYCNAFGWKEDFTITNTRLIEDLNISHQELSRIRNILVQLGRIKYTKGTGNRCGSYTLIPIVSQETANSVTQTGYKPDTNRIQTDTQCGTLNKLNKTKLDTPLYPPPGESAQDAGVNTTPLQGTSTPEELSASGTGAEGQQEPVRKSKKPETYTTESGKEYTLEELFERLYRMYPNKKDSKKKTAFKYFADHIKGRNKRKKLTPEQMAIAMQRYLYVKNGEYLHAPQTFFNEIVENYVMEDSGNGQL